MPGNELTYYDLLGLKPDASPDEIRVAYDALMVRMRPNVEYDSASTIRLAAAVKEAWETLGDPDKRRAYDETLKGTPAYGDIWRRSQQVSYVEERNKWFDQQVRLAQQKRQATHELEADRQQYLRDVEGTQASRRTVAAARENHTRAAAAKESLRRRELARIVRGATVAAAVITLVAAGIWFLWLRSLSASSEPGQSATASTHSVSPASNPVSPARGQLTRRPSLRSPQSGRSQSSPASPGTPAGPVASRSTTGSPEAIAAAHSVSSAGRNVSAEATNSRTSTGNAAGDQTHRRSSSHSAFRCTAVMIASVTHDGATVDLSDGSRFQLTDPVDRAEAGGWTTGGAVAKCAWPAAMNRPATLDVNGYTAHALPAAIVAATTPAVLPPGAVAASCADATITEVADDGSAIGLSDGHGYAVDDAGHVSVAAWLVGEPVSVCSTPQIGPKAFTVARYGNVVHTLRTLTHSIAASAPTLCVVRLVSALAGDGSRVVFNDGHTYRVDSVPSRTIVAGWTEGERVTVCIKLTNGTVYATLQHGSLTAHAVRAD